MQHIDLSPFMGRPLTDADWQHLMMRILFTPRANVLSYAESILKKAERQSGLNPELPDPLLTLLGFTRDTLPAMGHTFNSEMGNLFEAVVRVALKLSNDALYSDDFSASKDLLGKGEIEKFKKTTADCIFGSSAIEIKYRYGSAEGLTKQKEASKPLTAMGFSPVMLCFRSSPNSQEIGASGWSVFEGQEVIDYVQERTGYDLSRIFQLALVHPLIKKRIAALQAEYVERTKSKLEADFRWSPEGYRKPIHKLIAEDDDIRSEFLDDIGFEGDVLKGFMDYVLKDAEILKNPAFATLVAEVTNQKEEQTSQITKEAC